MALDATSWLVLGANQIVYVRTLTSKDQLNISQILATGYTREHHLHSLRFLSSPLILILVDQDKRTQRP